MIIKIERNYLEINSIKDLNYSKKPSENCNLQLIDPPDFQINKFFYKQIGKDHRWTDRLVWDDQKWIQYVESPKLKTYILQDKEDLIGYSEQIFNFEKKNCEIAYFGILKEYYGKRYGAYLLSKSIKSIQYLHHDLLSCLHASQCHSNNRLSRHSVSKAVSHRRLHISIKQ